MTDTRAEPGVARAFLHRAGLQAPGETATWTPLAGGVSADLWRVDLPGRTICVKRALPTLRVAAEWHAPIERNSAEYRWLSVTGRYAPTAVPRLLGHDPDAGVFAMEYLPPATHPVWKAELMAGRVDTGFATAVGDLLGRLHAASRHDPGLPAAFATDEAFAALRLDPYLRTTARRRPEVATVLYDLADRTAAIHRVLVHGDVSPKNILHGPAGPVLLDAECAWFGDPAFDPAFCLTHLVLKTLVRPDREAELRTAAESFHRAYFAHVDWEPHAELDRRIATLLPALLLARVDGSSPVEYLTAERARTAVRDFAVATLTWPEPSTAAVLGRWAAAGTPRGTMTANDRNHALLSTRRSADRVEVSVREVELPLPAAPDDIVVRMLAAPINPSDIGSLLGGADPATARRTGERTLVLEVPRPAEVDPATLGVVRPLGLEGAGRVVAAGAGRAAQALLGRVVSVMGTGTFARYVRVRAGDSVALPGHIPPAQGAAALINPLTVLGMVETMREEGFTALVHTAAASNLGRMLQRLCLAEGIGLVNVVRRPDQVELLRSLGAEHVVSTSSPAFFEELVEALRATGATLAFDAVSGGTLPADILAAMEQAAIRGGAGFPHGPRYGTTVPKKVYSYGGLDARPSTIERRFGFTWSIGGWLVFPFLERIGPERAARLRRRAVDEIGTTFASGYTGTVSLSALTDPETLRAVSRRATGEKYLLDLEGTDDDRSVR
ncbi:hypothetical protein [Amycolatopsis kentuckyensis]|uniref:hypothetical protein n=1 Tax=Amycolatopsis kentuckyensis TaxID=218823 RepID=UPI003564BD36